MVGDGCQFGEAGVNVDNDAPKGIDWAPLGFVPGSGDYESDYVTARA